MVKKYIIDTPPPFTSGALHIGHLYQFFLIIFLEHLEKNKYTVIKKQGFDCHGLPTYLKILKNHPQKSSSEIYNLCEEKTLENITNMKEQFKKIKRVVSYWKTSDKDYGEKIDVLISKCIDKKILYFGNYISIYCPKCKTSISKSETSFKTVDLNEYMLKIYSLRTNKEYNILTTKPEYILNPVLVLGNPADIRYKELENDQLLFPISNKKIPFYFDESVNIEYGSGLVMVSAYSSKMDVILCKKHNMIIEPLFNENSLSVTINPEYNNLDEEKLRLKIIKKLTVLNRIKHLENIKASKIQIHSERTSCKEKINYVLKKEFFIKITKNMKEQILYTINKVKFHNKNTKNTLKSWIQKIDDWCISRQYVYGKYIHLKICPKCNIIYYKLKYCPIDSTILVTTGYVYDCWLESSISWYYINTMDSEKSVRIQGEEIIRTWLAYSFISSNILGIKIPFTDVLTTKLVLDEKGRKISKSQNNYVPISILLKKYSLKVLYLWAITRSFNKNILFHSLELKQYYTFFKKIENLEKYVNSLNFKNPKLEKISHIEDLKIIGKYNILEKIILKNTYEYCFNQINKLIKFVKKDISNYYIEKNKHRVDESFKTTACLIMYKVQKLLELLIPPEYL